MSCRFPMFYQGNLRHKTLNILGFMKHNFFTEEIGKLPSYNIIKTSSIWKKNFFGSTIVSVE